MTRWFLPFLLLLTADTQGPTLPFGFVPQVASGPITLEASCTSTGTSAAYPAVCSTALSVSAGDTITCEASAWGFDPMSLHIGDVVNGYYDNVQATVHPGASNSWVVTAVKQNAAAGTYVPNSIAYEPANLNLACQAWKNTRTNRIIDPGSVLQLNTTTAANPTSGSATAPTYANEVVNCNLVYAASQATSSGGGSWLPAGSLTPVASFYSQYNQYQIQTTATAVNCPYTSGSAAYVDEQFAVLNGANPEGYRSLSGVYWPAIAKISGATVTAADLNGATTTLSTINMNGGWVLNGTAATYSNLHAPTGGKILVNGVPHTFGDSGTSILFPAALGAGSFYSWDSSRDFTWGTEMWISGFVYFDSAGSSNNAFCDVFLEREGVTENQLNVQMQYDTINGFGFILEPFESGSSALMTGGGIGFDTEMRVAIKIASVNERYHQLIAYTKSGGAWAQATSLNYDILCTTTPSNQRCATPTTVASTTGTASSGSTTLTVASATGITQGDVITGAGILDPSQGGAAWTTVASISGATITLSQNTSASLSSTAVNFYAAIPNMITATSGTAGSGSTALTVVAPGYGLISTGNAVGGPGIAPGTFVAAVSGTSVTLSQPTTAAISSTGITIWAVNGLVSSFFGRYSSCVNTGDIYESGFVYDPFNTWGAFAPN